MSRASRLVVSPLAALLLLAGCASVPTAAQVRTPVAPRAEWRGFASGSASVAMSSIADSAR